MTAGTLFAFWAVSMLFVITPGADWAYAISGGLRGAVAPAVSGLLLGHLVATLVVAAGVGAVLAAMPMAMAVLTLLGAGYLLVQGIGMVRTREVSVAHGSPRKGTPWNWLSGGVCVSGLNPKVFLLFLSLLPQFTVPSASMPVAAQIVSLGLVHVLSCGVVYVAVGLGARATLVSRPRDKRGTRLSGLAMIAIAFLLLGGQFSSASLHRSPFA